jgi:hypothetical protein
MFISIPPETYRRALPGEGEVVNISKLTCVTAESVNRYLAYANIAAIIREGIQVA